MHPRWERLAALLGVSPTALATASFILLSLTVWIVAVVGMVGKLVTKGRK